MNTETIETITAHRSVRKFNSDTLPDHLIEVLQDVMRRGPTSSDLQTYTFIFVQDSEVKRAVKPYAGDQRYISQCPLFIVACADLRRIQSITEARGHPYRAHDLRILISAIEDLTIAVHNASLAAQSLGLGTVMIGGVLNGASEISNLLNLPTRVVPILGLCVGYPTLDQKSVPARPRLPKQLVFHYDRYTLDGEDEQQLLEQHNLEVTELDYYQNRHIPLKAIYPDIDILDEQISKRDYGWTEHIARKQSRWWWTDSTPKLFSDLLELGLDLAPPPPSQQSGEKRSKV